MTDPQSIPATQTEFPREELYREWLGLKTGTPSYYGLLSLPELETDTTVIQHAGRRVKRKLRAYQIGPYRKHALDLLAEVGQAVSILTNDEKKKAYDRELYEKWLGTVRELYQAHCDTAPCEPGVLEAWLAACVGRGVPVTRLLPLVVRGMGVRLKNWPPHGEHQLPLPVALWIYRDAVILGQCLHIGTLGHRVEAVKSVQKVLGITEGLARFVAEEVTRGLHLFAHARFVAEAKRDPATFLFKMGMRIRRYGGHVGKHGTVLATMASLLALPKKEVDQAFAWLAEPETKLPSGSRRVKRAARKAVEEVREAGQHVALRPQLVVLSLAILAGVVAIVVAVLVATGVWEPWGPAVAPPPMPAPGAAPPGEKVAPTPPVSPSSAEPAGSVPDELLEFIKRYPAEKGARTVVAPQSPEPGETEIEPPAEKPPKVQPPKNGKAPTTFFNVPAEQRTPANEGVKAPAPSAKTGPAPKEPALAPKPPPPPDPSAPPEDK